eukprot:CAMPEP_0173378890 /NCGR_PEP_ID=MMETSP1356-20130122/2007_1 /TAXON_ID=77927 ORGANISM="Hemiselmis virescens, Strain PCC157" /NCGR_SAMPLE_ID=MMETSP1356 /ASSEMBLY_ACC=CAM_ASM_000847 /LENGTH=94 /DNA_ID=CAMNT_0014332115 /DNA_START=258 /DNA_END=542 /DNA_ORIENTATION=+
MSRDARLGLPPPPSLLPSLSTELIDVLSGRDGTLSLDDGALSGTCPCPVKGDEALLIGVNGEDLPPPGMGEETSLLTNEPPGLEMDLTLLTNEL